VPVIGSVYKGLFGERAPRLLNCDASTQSPRRFITSQRTGKAEGPASGPSQSSDRASAWTRADASHSSVPIVAGGPGPDFALPSQGRALTLALEFEHFGTSNPTRHSAKLSGDQEQAFPKRTLPQLASIVAGGYCPDLVVVEGAERAITLALEIGPFCRCKQIERSAKLSGDQEEAFPKRTLPHLAPIVAGGYCPDLRCCPS
jgi:hypothetical protein